MSEQPEIGTGPEWETLVREVCRMEATARCETCELSFRGRERAAYQGAALVLRLMGVEPLFHQTREQLYGKPWPLFDVTAEDTSEYLVPDIARGGKLP